MDYRTMYFALFNAVTDAVARLNEVQRETERMYMESGEGNMVVLNDHRSPRGDTDG